MVPISETNEAARILVPREADHLAAIRTCPDLARALIGARPLLFDELRAAPHRPSFRKR